MTQCTRELFLKDVAKHVMTVLKDDGVYRHIVFKQPSSNNMRFDLVTYPGHLVFSGDMGSWVFNRLEDMFEFFRTDGGRINPQYWSEKLQAASCSGRSSGSAEEFSPERFTRVINEYRVQWVRDAHACRSLDKDERRELWEAVDDEVLSRVDEGEHVAFQAAHEFHWSKVALLPGTYPTYSFEDLWEHRFTDYTFHFLWCCYALAYGIGEYDKKKGIT